MSLLSLAGVPDLGKIIPNAISQAKDAGIQIEDHAVESLRPFIEQEAEKVLSKALSVVQQAEQPILTEIAALRTMLEPVCATIARLGSGVEIHITPKTGG